MVDRIKQSEPKAERSLMHRFNLAKVTAVVQLHACLVLLMLQLGAATLVIISVEAAQPIVWMLKKPSTQLVCITCLQLQQTTDS